MNRTKTIYFLGAMVLILGCYVLNLSYSLFVQTEEREVVNSVVPSLVYNLENNIFNIPANSGKLIKLKVINSSASDIKYGISVYDTKGTTIQLVEGNDIIGTLESSNVEGENSSKDVLVYVTNPTEDEITDLTFNIVGKYATLNFDETFKDSSNIDYKNVVNVSLLNETVLANAQSGEVDRSVYTEPEDLPTIPAEEISGENEKILSYADDNYGISYYFRGNVEDNYVNFAGMCWRIVRIDGLGKTKLILEDQYTECDDTSLNDKKKDGIVYTGNWRIGIGNYGYVVGNFIDGLNGSNNEYLMNYLNPISNSTSSMVKTFYDFQTTSNLKNYIDRLEVGNWCLGDKAYIYNDSLGTYLPLQEYDYSGMFYDANLQLESDNEYPLTLKCNGTELDIFLNVTGVSSEAPMYVGAITASEIAYAGAKKGAANYNSNYYIINDFFTSTPSWFWTLSPDNYHNSSDFILGVQKFGYLFETFPTDGGFFRPVILLKSDNMIVGGKGTITEPYVIG